MKKTKNIFLFLLSSLLIFSISLGAEIKINVNGKYIDSDIPPFIQSGTTYVPIRFISTALDVDSITWDESSRTVGITNGSDKIMLAIGKSYAYVNDTYVSLTKSPMIVDGRTFVPLRFISQSFGADVDWDADTYTVTITNATTSDSSSSSSSTESSSSSSSSNSSSSSSGSSTPSRGESSRPSSTPSTSTPSTSTTTPTYTEDEVYWLSRIIEAEAAGEPFAGKVAVGEVILNRVASSDFPNTIWTVIFDNKFGVQFEPTINGTIYNTPSEESINAAKTALSGSNYVGDCLYFLNPTKAQSNWIVKNRTYYTTIANHDFYL